MFCQISFSKLGCENRALAGSREKTDGGRGSFFSDTPCQRATLQPITHFLKEGHVAKGRKITICRPLLFINV